MDQRTLEEEDVPPTNRPVALPPAPPNRPAVAQPAPTNVVVQVGSQVQRDAVSGEHVFYQSGAAGGIRITNTRAVLGGTLFSMANITSVACFEEKPNYGAPILLGFLGLLPFMAGLGYSNAVLIIVGVVIILIAIVWARFLPTWYVVLIQSSSGVPARPVRSQKEEFIQEIVRAFHDAIIHRG